MADSSSFDAFYQQLAASQQQLWQQWMNVAAPAPNGAAAEQNAQQNKGLTAEWPTLQAQWLHDQMTLWATYLRGTPAEPLIQPEAGDRRFAAPEWDAAPFSFIKQNYLLTARLLNTLAATHASGDAAARSRQAYFTRQLTDALSPANFAFTNPEVMKLAAETEGASLQQGMQKLAEDVRKGTITMTDESAFEVGRNLATTEGAVVFENELFQLLQYKPLMSKVSEVPLLIVPPCVNKFYIMDLQPSNSMVRWCVAQGQTVFLVSWRSIPAELGHLQWDDYVEDGIIKAVEVSRAISKQPQINVLSFCIGGVLVATAMPVLQARGHDWIASLTLMAAMLDHADPGDIQHFIDWNLVSQREAQLAAGAGGLVSGKELSRTFAALRANDLVWHYVVHNYLKGKTPPPFDLLYWNNDGADLAMPMHTFFLKNMYLQNNLTRPDSFSLCGVPIDLGQIKTPTYIFAAREDHIVPWQAAWQSTHLLGGPTRFVLGASGHIAGTINPPAANKRSYWTRDAAVAEPQQWLDGAEQHAGSWWTDWLAWLQPFTGKKVAARKTLGNATYKPIEPAPGRYVKAKAG
ncbi:class I poly(R)-hydroxyalkanoic acid synthase [Silvimonas sp. JCM 19000]